VKAYSTMWAMWFACGSWRILKPADCMNPDPDDRASGCTEHVPRNSPRVNCVAPDYPPQAITPTATATAGAAGTLCTWSVAGRPFTGTLPSEVILSSVRPTRIPRRSGTAEKQHGAMPRHTRTMDVEMPAGGSPLQRPRFRPPGRIATMKAKALAFRH
jgi:hypothetical protein